MIIVPPTSRSKACGIAVALSSCLHLIGCLGGSPTLRELPPELAAVLADEARFSDPDNPFRATVVGTEIDPPALLDGCWGSIETEMIGDGSYVEAQSLRIDVGRRTVERGLYQGVDGKAFPGFNRPTVRGFQETLESTDGGTIRRTIRHVDSAGVNPSGELVYDASADFGAFLDQGTEYSRRFPLNGDLLLVEDSYPDGDVDLFARFDCP